MALPDFTMRGLLESGAHFGHQSHRWNPKMAPYIFGARNNIHIIDLAQTVPLMHQALKAVSDTVARGGRVLFVGTKRQAQDQIADAAKRSAQYYINSRWLGGMLTNWKTISGSIQRLRKIDEQLDHGAVGLTKKERLMMSREREKLEKALGGIKDMGGVPDLIFVIDTNKEQLAIKEAARLNIPVAAILDTNSDPDGITFPIPAKRRCRPRHQHVLRPRGPRRARWHPALARLGRRRPRRDGGAHRRGAAAVRHPRRSCMPPTRWRRRRRMSPAMPSPRSKRISMLRPRPSSCCPRRAVRRTISRKSRGVGPQIVKKLNDGGIFHYWQIAAMTPEDITKVEADLKLGGRIERDGWINQARTLLAA